MEFFHFMQGFLSSGTLGFHCTKNKLPDVLEDVWINVAIGEQEKALEIIDNVPEKHPFENRYNMGVEHIDWESCSEVLDKKEKREFLKKGWIRCMNV